MATQSQVLVLKVGPVQGFISQSRRTRDLWFGSHLLSHVSRAMARSLQASGAELIFPHPEQLQGPTSGPECVAKEDAETPKGFPNKVLAVLTGDPESIARAARTAARDALLAAWERVRHKCGGLLAEGADAWANEQLETFLEFHAAWVPQGEGGYAVALEEAEALLEARRALREFKAWTQLPPAGTHKSSLDGGRPSVLRGKRSKGGEWKGLRIGEREELDALGLLKRAGGDPGQFVPVPSIGLAAWLETASKEHNRELSNLRGACADGGFTKVHRTDLSWVNAFPFDGQVLLPERVLPCFEEWSDGGDRKSVQLEAERFAAGAVQPLLDVMGVAPYPYVACLCADGDNMGQALRELAVHGGIEAHRGVSRALANFTSEAKDIVQSRFRGMLVYAGGDDVLAFVCPPDAVACARELASAFQRHLKPAINGAVKELPTLSVGLGIGHVLESLGQLLNLGRQAEKAAKNAGRNALAILLAKHAGRERLWTSSWVNPVEPVGRLAQDMTLLSSGRLPLSKVHEVEAMSRRFAADVADSHSKEQAEVLVDEVRRILSRAEAGRREDPMSLADVGLEDLSTSDGRKAHAKLQEWVSRVLVAETLERAGRKLEPRKGGEG
ncbi:CRISPR-associated Cmr2 family protein [Myxococcus stipitatus DSM 14675]|uniref:CRISPR-associated Cmr2 family protein n=1 Tax=Myxococcus stipitatus (strain DSM 14675 / JCM 12634 / Mx s8) TaxID=1278073 RepID=L7UNP9_MYXSD|nr:type III-B CRISPR-associated protein Cas10/Cmr2 [Myxococcus stipitatus]AGC49207.1 CRISPR-associated Cmr2 family protein [Myxococcus stipitatus DSM 14675]